MKPVVAAREKAYPAQRMTDPAASSPVPPAPSEPTPPVAPRRRRRWPFVLLLLVAVGAGWVFTHRAAGTGADAAKAPRETAVPVALATVEKGDLDITERALGTVTPLAAVTVRTQISGTLQSVAFEEGQTVEKDAPLAQIDPRPYEAVKAQYEGDLKKDQGLLVQARADLERYKKLSALDSIAKQKLDAQIAAVQQYEGAVQSDQAQIDAAALNISYCHIVAPFAGRVGLRQVDPGNYVTPSDSNGLVTLTQLRPISVLFTLPEDSLPAVTKRLAAGAALKVEAFDRGQNARLAEGQLVAVDNQIDTTTGTIKLRARFENDDSGLFPNQFVNVVLTVDTLKDATLAPQTAVLRGAPGTFVYVAKDDGTVALRVVKLGPAQGDKVAIEDGLAPGDKVVTDGTDKLRDGAKYKIPEKAAGAARGAP